MSRPWTFYGTGADEALEDALRAVERSAAAARSLIAVRDTMRRRHGVHTLEYISANTTLQRELERVRRAARDFEAFRLAAAPVVIGATA